MIVPINIIPRHKASAKPGCFSSQLGESNHFILKLNANKPWQVMTLPSKLEKAVNQNG